MAANDSDPNGRDLREAARRRLAQPFTDVSEWTAADAQALVAELELHQEELRIQNEELQNAWAEVSVARDRYRDLFEQAPAAYLIVDGKGRIHGANRRAEELLGMDFHDMEGADFAPFIVPEDQDAWFHFWRSLSVAMGRRAEELRLRPFYDGSERTVHLEAVPDRGTEPADPRFRCALSDITARAEAERFSRTLLESLGEGVVGLDAAGAITFVNPAGLKLLGYDSEEELLGEEAHRRIHHTDGDGKPYAESDCPIVRVMNSEQALEGWQDWLWRRDGTGFPAEINVTPLSRSGAQFEGGVLVFTDITEQRRQEEQLRYQAHHDALTGLLSRGTLEEALDREMARLQRYGGTFALIMLDLDHFKAVNDRYGHDVGDRVLEEFAQRAQTDLRSADLLGRWGGEELVAILPETETGAAGALAERIRYTVAESVFDGGVWVTVSLGVAGFSGQESRSGLLKRLDDALYRAKEMGRNRVVVADPDR